MDYEKKYRDLVEAVKELQEANPHDEGIQKWIEDNIPELEEGESEDEKIRKKTTCKLSDEHYELEEFAKIVRCNLTGISEPVQKLFEAKYLQLTGNKMYEGFKD